MTPETQDKMSATTDTTTTTKNVPKWTKNAYQNALTNGQYTLVTGNGSSSLLISGARSHFFKYTNGMVTNPQDGPRIYVPSLRLVGTYKDLLRTIQASPEAQDGHLRGEDFLSYHIGLGSYQPSTVVVGGAKYNEEIVKMFEGEIRTHKEALKRGNRRIIHPYHVSDIDALYDHFVVTKQPKNKPAAKKAPKKTKTAGVKRAGGGSITSLQTRIARIESGDELYIDVDNMKKNGSGAKNMVKYPAATSKKRRSALAGAPPIYATKSENYTNAMSLLGAEYLVHANAFKNKNTVGLAQQTAATQTAGGFAPVQVNSAPVPTTGVSPVLVQSAPTMTDTTSRMPMAPIAMTSVSPVLATSQAPVKIPFVSPNRMNVLSPTTTAPGVGYAPLGSP